ncbi:unnamed protein product [Pedinophyceae sp. YPF-701]|nr:unnamed protein product [Pedinophyceae sp. YPF-701]
MIGAQTHAARCPVLVCKGLGAGRRRGPPPVPVRRAMCPPVLRRGVACMGGNIKYPAELDEFNPFEILRVGKGTTFEGLLRAREIAAQNAQGDAQKLADIEKAFRVFVDGAKERFIKQVAQAPDSHLAHFELANFYQTVGALDEAEESYRRAIALNPNHVDSLNNLATLLQEARGRPQEAVELYERAVAAAPEDVDVLFQYALCKLALGDSGGYRELVEKIVGIQPELAEHPLIKAQAARLGES